MADRVDSEPAVLLHRKMLGENQWLFEMLTEHHGRVGLFVRGRKAVLHAQPFAPLCVSWRGRGDLPTLSLLEPEGRSVQLVGDALVCGLYLNELLLRILQRWEPVPDILPSYLATLERLDGEGPQRPLREFEWWLLGQLGFALDLASVRRDGYYRWQESHGLVSCGEQEGVAGDLIIAAAEGQWDKDGVPGVMKRLNRWRLAPLLGHRPLNTRKLFAKTSSGNR